MKFVSDMHRAELLDDVLREVIRPATILVGVVYLGIGWTHWLVLSGAASYIVGGSELAVSFGLMALAIFSRDRIYGATETHIRAALPVQLRAVSDAKLALIRERLGRLTEHAHDIIVEVDLAGEIRYANQAAFTVLGYAPEDLIGQDGEGIAVEHEGSVSLSALRHRMRSESSSESVLMVKHRDGSPRWLEISAQRYRGV